MPFIGYHALDRYRLHKPDAETEDVELALHWGTPMSSEFVQILTQRHKADNTCRYVLSPDKMGIFVINKESDFVVTYLRLHDSQRQVFMEPARPLIDPGPSPRLKVEPEPRERRERRSLKPVCSYNEAYLAELDSRYRASLPNNEPEDETTEEIPSDEMVALRRRAFESKILEQYGLKAG